MEFPKPRRILLSFALIAVLYAVFFMIWLRARGPYASAMTTVATEVGFPVLGLDGAVSARPGRWIILTYTVPDARTGGWGQAKQRFFDFSDLPLAAAAGLGFLYLGWRRRLVVAAVSCLVMALCHLGLVMWSAHRLSSLLGERGLAAEEVDRSINEITAQATGFGNISTAVTLAVVGTLTVLIARFGSPIRSA